MERCCKFVCFDARVVVFCKVGGPLGIIALFACKVLKHWDPRF